MNRIPSLLLSSTIRSSIIQMRLCILFCVAYPVVTNCQSLSEYSFSSSTKAYVSLANATEPVINNGSWNGIPIGFNFIFDGITYTHFSASHRGILKFNDNFTSFSPTIFNTDEIRITPCGSDYLLYVNGISKFFYKTEGSAPNRILSIEWKDMYFQNSPLNGPNVSFQVRLYEATSQLEFNYNKAIVSNRTLAIGIKTSGTLTNSCYYLQSGTPNPELSRNNPYLAQNIYPVPETNQLYTFTPYCEPAVYFTPTYFIDYVSLSTLKNTTGNDGGYKDFSDLSVNNAYVGVGNTYQFSFSNDFPASSSQAYWNIYVDLNNDGDFNDSQEKIYDSYTTSKGLNSFQYTVSTSYSFRGGTKMRVIMSASPISGPCNSLFEGEIEDYRLVIEDSSPPLPPGSLVSSMKYTMFTARDGSYEPLENGIELPINFSGFNSLPIGFSFSFNGKTYTKFSAHIRGIMMLNKDFQSTFPTIFNTSEMRIAPLGNSSIQANKFLYQTIGSAPNRILVAEWKDVFYQNTTLLSFQVRLYETTNRIEFIYGVGSSSLQISNLTIGIKDQGLNDFMYLFYPGGTDPQVMRSNLNTSESWTGKPKDGLTYAFIPYCESSGNPNATQFIDLLKFGSSISTSGNDNGYKNFTEDQAITSYIKVGDQHEIGISNAAGSGNAYWNVYCDLNADGDFNDLGELQFTGSASNGINHYYPQTFTSNYTYGGPTKLRVIMSTTPINNNPCSTSYWGEVEEYRVVVTNVIGDNSISSNLGNCVNMQNPGSLTGSLPTGGNGFYSYVWQRSTDGMTWSNIGFTSRSNFNADPYVLSPVTHFRRQVTSGTAQPSYSNIITVLGANNAIQIVGDGIHCPGLPPPLITGNSMPSGTTYQWYMKPENFIKFSVISGATGKDYQPGYGTIDYNRTASIGSCNSIASNTIPLVYTQICESLTNQESARIGSKLNSQEDSQAAQTYIFPNPAREKLHITGTPGPIVIWDMTGKVVKQESFTKELEVSTLPDGVYMGSVGTRKFKFVKISGH